MIDDDGRRHLLLDKRWTLRERWRYTKAIEYGEFAIAADILFTRLTPEEQENTLRRAKELAKLFGIQGDNE